VLDVGCGEGSLLQILINDSKFSQLAGIDVDQKTIELAAQNCQPTEYDFDNLREKPLFVDIFKGSLDLPDFRCREYCHCLSRFDAAVCVEVIEHLDQRTLEGMPKVFFGTYSPKVAVITTPNAEFNVHFESLPAGKFRHYDHKFEWTRKEFQDW
jgi:SAM-dependent methyltransferase